MAATDAHIQDLFQQRFQSMEMPVDPAVWENISARLGHGAAPNGSVESVASGTKGGFSSGILGWVAVGSIAIGSIVGIALWSDGPATAEKQIVVVQNPAADNDPQLEPPSASTSVPVVPEESRTEKQTEVVTEVKEAVSPKIKQEPNTAQKSNAGDKQPREIPQKTTAPAETMAGDKEGLVTVPSDGNGGATNTKVQQKVPPADEPVNSEPMGAPEPTNDEAPPQEMITIPEPEDYFSGNEIRLGNVFSPNGDGSNETYLPEIPAHENVLIRIFSGATGNIVFSADELVAWNGRMADGAPCPEGTYFYVIEVLDDHGKVHTARQTVRLFR